ncbi:MAG: AGE family epimerase/isomerase [Bacteroidaceae bacterium]|nr:AGE family epimerase/isomerase [Bacteroidaceae bacterium]
MNTLEQEVRRELTENILPFWMNAMPDGAGGFIGRIDGTGRHCPDAERGAILNARILWTFAAAWRMFKVEKYRETAETAYRYIVAHFIDREYGGVYWSLNPDGTPKDGRKQFYAIAFVIYALAEYYAAVGDGSALEEAVGLFRCIEKYSLDRVYGGYLEACTRDWGTIGDMRLSDKDQNDAKTMNTHLHVLEAYTGLFRVWPDAELGSALWNIIRLFLDRIVCSDGHLGLFFDEKWQPRSTMISYGHDIEASWLLCEAASALGEEKLTMEVLKVSERMARASMEGFTPDSGMEYEYDPDTGYRNRSREWWVQAETVVGCLNQYRLSGDTVWKTRALAEWNFIRRNIICPEGEWYWSAIPDGDGFRPDTANDRAGFWKCPYHNGRMCMELQQLADGIHV